MRPRTIGAWVMAVAFVVGGCGSGDSDDDTTTSTTSLVSTTTTTVVTADPMGNVPEILGSGNFDASAAQLTKQFEAIAEGSYLIPTLGIPFSITVSGDWWVQPNKAGFTVLTHPDSFGPGDRDVVFIRPTGLSDPANLSAPYDDQQLWPVADLEGWLAGLDSGVVTSTPQPVSLGGRDAVSFDLSLTPEFECGPTFCALFADARTDGKTLDPRYDFRVWWVDGAEFEPLAVVVGSGPEGSDFFATAESLLSTIAFGAPGPHPIPADADLWTCGVPDTVPAGTVELASVGGLRLTLPEERFVIQRFGFTAIDIGRSIVIDFMIVQESAAGETIASVDDVLAALEAAGMVVAEVGTATLVGAEARVFDVSAERGKVLTPALVPDWATPNLGRLWLAETERGVFLVGAETIGSQDLLDQAIAEAEAIIPTMEFIDPPCPTNS